MTKEWIRLPALIAPAAVLALAADSGRLWASGPGGVAWHTPDDEWRSRASGLPLSDVAALAYADGWLFAGGAEGIARSPDNGCTWQIATIAEKVASVTAMAVSPNFVGDSIVLAATLTNGVVRSTDAGLSWQASSDGMLVHEATAVVWADSQHPLVGTIDGIYISHDVGQHWQLAAGSEQALVAALALHRDGTALAALEVGGLLRSTDGGESWQPFGNLPVDAAATALAISREGVILVGTVDGLLRSLDHGNSWEMVYQQAVFALAEDTTAIYAGTIDGVIGLWADLVANPEPPTWQTLPRPPLHDLRTLQISAGIPIVSGVRTAPMRYRAGSWQLLDNVPVPLTAFTTAPDGCHWASSTQGLFRSLDDGATWHEVLAGEQGCVRWLSFDSDGCGWAGSNDGSRLLVSSDHGKHWKHISSPATGLPLVALLALPGIAIAGTYDSRHQLVQIWRTQNGGKSWEQIEQRATSWPLVAALSSPPLLSVDAMLVRPHTNWEHSLIGDGAGQVRRLVAHQSALLALTTSGILRTDDDGRSWARDDDGLPFAQVIDLALEGETLYALLAGGEVWSRAL